MNALKELAFVSLNWPSFSSIGYRVRGLDAGLPEDAFAGETWLVTGASGGIGEAITTGAAAAGARVNAVARSKEKLDALVAASAEGQVEAGIVDLSPMAAVAEEARDLVKSGQKFNVLVNNVGILNNRFRRTEEGFEQSYAVNLLGHYILTEILIRGGALSKGGVVINMASGGLYNVPLNLDYLNQAEEAYDGVAAYASHKRAQLALSDHWRTAWPDAGLSFYTMHPGWADTDGVKRSLPAFRKLMKSILRDGEQAADTALWLARTRPEEKTDRLWFDRAPRSAHVFPDTRKPKASLEELVGQLEADARSVGALV